MVVGAWVASAMLGVSSPSPARATAIAQADAPDPRTALAQGDEARRRGDLDDADRLYRRAWMDPASRARATASLRSLERAGRTTQLDETHIAQTTVLLTPAFRRYESDHFVLLTDAPRSAAQSKLAALERAEGQFTRAMDRLGVSGIPAEHKLLTVLFANHGMFREFAAKHDQVQAEWIAGYYAGLSNRAVFYEDSAGPNYADAMNQLAEIAHRTDRLREQAREARQERRSDDARTLASRADELNRKRLSEQARLDTVVATSTISKTIHESIHLLAFNTGVQSRLREYPFWLTEGLATSFETDRPLAAFGPDRPSDSRDASLSRSIEDERLLSLRELVSLTAPPPDDSILTETIYAQAWSLFRYLARTERQSLAGFFSDMLEEPAGRMTDRRRIELFERRFGDADRLDRRWRMFVERTSPALAAESP